MQPSAELPASLDRHVPGAKLIRDLVPAIIEATGEQPITWTARPGQYHGALLDKLAEECEEAQSAAAADLPGELADVLEVVRALAELAGISPGELERLRALKAEERGTFAGRVMWAGNRGPEGERP